MILKQGKKCLSDLIDKPLSKIYRSSLLWLVVDSTLMSWQLSYDVLIHRQHFILSPILNYNEP